MSSTSIIYSIIFLFYCLGFSQKNGIKTYSLHQCIEIALKNNLDLKSTILNTNTERINHKQAKANILPNLNGSYTIGVNNGRSIDPFTNDFINQELTFSNARLSLDATIFNGFRLMNSIRQQRFNRKAAEMEIEEAQQTLILNVTLAYLQVLNREDVLGLAKNRLITTNQQVQRQEDLYQEEFGNPADFADIKGQKTLDETSILTAESALKNAKLSLSRLMNITHDIAVDRISILLDFKEYAISSDTVFTEALQNLATFKAKELRVKAARKGVSVAKSQYIPEISLFGQLNTNYSSVAETFTEIGSTITETGDFVTINNENVPVFTNQTQFRGENIEYLDQLDNNLNTVIGVAVNIPLFNGFRAKNNVSIEKIKAEESLIELERTAQDVKNAIEQVHFDMRTAFNRYKSLENQVKAFEESYRINEIRFNSGVSNFIAYITSKNNLDNAKTNLANAKYEYLLRVKVLEFYRGESL